MTKKQKIFTLVGIVAIALSGYFIYEHLTYVTTDNAQLEAHSLMLSSKVGGFVQSVHVKEGQSVKKGDLLIEIDDRDYKNNLQQMTSELTSLQARRTDAEKNFKRLQQLYSSHVVSQQQFENSTASYSEVKAKYSAVEAQVAQAELNLKNTKIYAPEDGFIARKSAEPGQLSAPGVPLIGFVSSGERWVIANFKETDIEDIKIGAKVLIDVDAITSKTFTGKVISISSATGATFTLLPPDNSTGNFTKVVQRVPVRIQIENIDEKDVGTLRAGLSAEVKVKR